jgi:hypothetical protein
LLGLNCLRAWLFFLVVHTPHCNSGAGRVRRATRPPARSAWFRDQRWRSIESLNPRIALDMWSIVSA